MGGVSPSFEKTSSLLSWGKQSSDDTSSKSEKNQLDSETSDLDVDQQWFLPESVDMETLETEGEKKYQPRAGVLTGTGSNSGVSEQALALPDGSGTMQGMGESFTPNLNTGTGTFSIPIKYPAGRRALQPTIGLGYGSGTGNGPVGWGWSLGVPFISRQTDKGIPRYNDADRFIYNGGQELIHIAMPPDEAWPSDTWDPSICGDDIVYYRARFEAGFLRFFFNKTRDKWLVQDREGKQYTFGERDTDKVFGQSGTYKWSVSKIEDLRRASGGGGNDIRFEYLEDGNNIYISNIYWNSYGQAYGEVEAYQHQLRFVYELRPDASESFATGFRVEQNLRLARIEVRSYQYAPTGDRPLVRVYLLQYQNETESIHSKLVQVTTCGSNWSENEDGTCLLPLRLSYSQIQGIDSNGYPSDRFIDGFGAFDEVVRELKTSPDVSPEDADVEFMDVNQDGLPDLIITKESDAYFGEDHAVIFNDGLGHLDSLKAKPIKNPEGSSLSLRNLNVSILDIDGAGNGDLLHMPYAQKYHFYRLKKSMDEQGEEAYSWVASEEIPLNPDIDFTKDAMDIRLVDINNDHLIDIVRSTGNRMQHFLNLSAFPETEGQFGRLDEKGKPVPNESIDTCVLMRGETMQFHDGNLHFGDMNGDGLQDIVDLTSGSIAYWPNRGYGRWGDSNETCGPNEIKDGLAVEMSDSPWFSNPENEGVSVADMNGDGLADLIQIRFDEVDIWFNRGDSSFSDRYTIVDTPKTNSGFYGRVSLVDINGSGTVDIVWADAGGYRYIDLAGDYREQPGNGGLPSGFLERVQGATGSVTQLEYATTTELMVDAKQNGNPWKTVAPFPNIVIRKVTSLDNMDIVGEKKGEYIQEFMYRDPFYDGHEAELKGFGYAEAWDREKDVDGDGVMDSGLCSDTAITQGEAPLVSRSWFHRGVRPECMEPPIQDGWGPDSEACWDKQHRDNPLAGLTGSAIKSDVYSPCTGRVLTSTLSEIEVRKLFDNADPNDDRDVYFIIPNHGVIYKYDVDRSASANSQGVEESYEWITINTDGEERVLTKSYVTDAPLGHFHRIDGSVTTDNRGVPTQAYFGGFHRYPGDDFYKFANCDQYTEIYTVDRDPATWVYTAKESMMIGPTPEVGTTCDSSGSDLNNCTAEKPCNNLLKSYNAFGELIETRIRYWDYDGSGDDQGGGREITAVRKDYNTYGQLTDTWAGCSGTDCKRHSQNIYQSEDDGDEYYSAHIRQQVFDVPDGEVTEFVSFATWDAGTSQITYLKGASGAEGKVYYDALGRFKAAHAVNPQNGKLCEGDVMAKTVAYHFDSAPMPHMVTRINRSKAFCGDDEWDLLYTWVDSTGSPYASVVPGDKDDDGEYPWLLSGTSVLNKKRGVLESCEGVPIHSPPLTGEQLVALQKERESSMATEISGGKWNCSKQTFDVYGRPSVNYIPSNHPDAVDGYIWTQAKYGLDSAYTCDHLDIFDEDNQGTCGSMRLDGLGRIVESTTWHRESDDGEPVARKITAKYGAIGGALVVTREEKGEKVSRSVAYDTLGRLRVNTGLNFGTWRYSYDDLGQMVRTETPTGDVHYNTYDQAGRIVMRSFTENGNANETIEATYFYDVPPDETALGLDGNPYWTGYPQSAMTLGRLVAVKDRSGVSIAASDFGTYSEAWKQVFPSDRLYHFKSEVNNIGQLVYDEDPDGAKSYANYYNNGALRSTSTEVWQNEQWALKTIVADTKYNYRGQAELVAYGDGGQTQVWSGFNSVTGQTMNTVAQRTAPGNAATLMSFGYQYDAIGKLVGISDWRGRTPEQTTQLEGLSTLFPTSHTSMRIGYHHAAYPTSEGFSDQMTPPSEVVGEVTKTGWPVGMTPSDAVFEYDSLYQLTGEKREYVTEGALIDGTWTELNGDDVVMDEEGNPGERRLREVFWDYDSQGSMASWHEGNGAVATKNRGRALGHIVNGISLLREGGCDTDVLSTSRSIPTECRFKPDALYHANNIGDVPQGRATCVWATYDAGGHMVEQVIRTGCSVCEHGYGMGYNEATCSNTTIPEQGTPGQSGYLPAIEPEMIRYVYYWNGLGQLKGAEKYVNSSIPDITMSYVYDASGGRVIREKSTTGVSEIYQDLYIAGGYERRQVQLVDEVSANPSSVYAAEFKNGAMGVYEDVSEKTRLVKYAAGARVQRRYTDVWEDAQVFITLSNHLGSTSAVIDHEDGTLVEWNTNYAYGADESRWKNPADKYNHADEPYGFTGKEEDEAIGLHYFGARYYSSYIARWISPDPPVVQGAGMSNFYNYGANTPYIAVDPDGNWVQYLVAAIVGSIKGTINGIISGAKNGKFEWQDVVMTVVKSLEGAGEGVCSVVNPYLGALASTGSTAINSVLENAMYGGEFNKEFYKIAGINTGISAASSFGSAGLGSAVGAANLSSGWNTAASVGIGMGSAVAAQGMAVGTGLADNMDWENTIKNAATGIMISMAASRVGSELESLVGGTQGGRDFNQARDDNEVLKYGRQQATPISENEEVMNRRISYIKFSNGDTVTAAEFSNASASSGYITTQELIDYAWENSFSLNNSNQREVAVGIFDSGNEVFAVVQTGDWGAKQVDGNFLSNTMSGSVILLDELHTHPWTDRNQGWLPTIASGNASRERGDVFSADMLDGFAAGYAGESGKEFVIPGHYILTHPTPQRQGEPNRPWLYRYNQY